MTYRQQAIANGIKPFTYDMRVQRGWTPERAATTPARPYYRD